MKDVHCKLSSLSLKENTMNDVSECDIHVSHWFTWGSMRMMHGPMDRQLHDNPNFLTWWVTTFSMQLGAAHAYSARRSPSKIFAALSRPIKGWTEINCNLLVRVHPHLALATLFSTSNEFLITFEWRSDWEAECDKWTVSFETNSPLEPPFTAESSICEWGDETFRGRDAEAILGLVEALVVVDKCGWRDEEVLKISLERTIDFDGAIELSLKDLVGNGIVLVVLDRGLFLVVFDWGFVTALDDAVTFVAICPSKV